MEATRICQEIDKMMHLLHRDSQAAWVILSTAMAHQLDYSLSLQYPTDMLECATRLDARLSSNLPANITFLEERREQVWSLPM